MSVFLEVPDLDDLSDLGIVIEPSESCGVVSLTAWASDGSSVTLTWDEIAGSASVRWVDGDDERLVIEQETASKISVRNEQGCVQFRIWSSSEGLRGVLLVQVGQHVSVRGALLRT